MIQQRQSGFTLVELVIALTLGGIVISAFLVLYLTGLNVNTQVTRHNLAKNIAYNELLKYTETNRADWSSPFLCDTTQNDTKATPAAPGQLIATVDLTTNYRLPAPATLTIRAFAPYGCAAPEMPLLIKSLVTYGPNSLQEVYATYSNK